MRLRMIMKAPAVIEPAGVESFIANRPLADTGTLPLSHRGLIGYVWHQYADSLISDADPGMECCESAEEILQELSSAPGRPEITRTGLSLWRICNSLEDAAGSIFLEEEEDGGIYLNLNSDGERFDISDFGPGSAAGLILNLLDSYGTLDRHIKLVSGTP